MFTRMEKREEELPGFRFHPTEQELVEFYLKRKVQGTLQPFRFIPELHLYNHDPWELPLDKMKGGEEGFFFVPKDESSYRKSGKPRRITPSGYWKATGSDRSVLGDNMRMLARKKTLVFYVGRAPRGEKTNWVMNEYRLAEILCAQNDVALCRVHRKPTPHKELEKQALINAMRQEESQHRMDVHEEEEEKPKPEFLEKGEESGNNESALTWGGDECVMERIDDDDEEQDIGSILQSIVKHDEDGVHMNRSLNTQPLMDLPSLLCGGDIWSISDDSWSPSSLLCTPVFHDSSPTKIS